MSALKRGILGKVDHVDGRLVFAQGNLDRALKRGLHVFVGKRHRALGVGDDIDGGPRRVLELGGDGARVAQRGAHEEELRAGKGQKRHLPGPAAVAVAEVVELVHCDVADVGPLALAKGRVCQDLGRAADDHGTGVDGGVARDHADVLLAEDVAQVEELLAHQGLDGGGVIRLPALAQSEEVHAEGHHRLA